MSVIAPAEGVDDHPPHLEPSQLGTKEYWESFYDNSLSHLSSKRRTERKKEAKDRNKEEREEEKEEEEEEEDADDYDSDEEEEEEDDDDDDPGTSWFTEHNAPEKVMRFLTSSAFPLAPCNNNHNHNHNNNNNNTQSQSQPTILDLGTGNGSMLALLRDEGGFTSAQM
ncbi:hypothetical protein ACJ72_06549, partial [Emergomyces africanus]